MSSSADADDQRRWALLATVLVGTFVGTINNSIANVALLDVIDEFDLGLSAGVWFVTAYVLAFAVLMPVAGRLADVFGARRVYVVGLAGFGVASLAAALAPTFPVAVAARIAQGVCNAPVLPTVMLVIASTFPAQERARAMAIWAAVNGAAIAVGPPLGGVMTDAFGWRSIFWLDLPLIIVALLSARRYLPETERAPGRSLDLRGCALFAGGVLVVMAALAEVPDRGWLDPLLLSLLGVGVGLLAAYVRHAGTHHDPLIAIATLRNRHFATLTAVAALQMVVLFGVLLTIPLLFVSSFDRGIGAAGALAFALPVTMVLAAPMVGAASVTVGARHLIETGGVFLAAGGVVLALGADAHLGVVIAGLVITGAGVAAIQAPAAAAVGDAVSGPDRGAAMGMFHTSRFLAGVLGTAGFAAVLGDDAFEVAFGLAAILGLAVIVVARGLPGTAPAPHAKDVRSVLRCP